MNIVKETTIAKYNPETCPKDIGWFEQGGRCGWAHLCKQCTRGIRYAKFEEKMKQKNLLMKSKDETNQYLVNIGVAAV